MHAFADSATASRRLTTAPGTVDKLRALVKHGADGQRIRAHGEALISYWGTVSDLANRQVHNGQREKETLVMEDARRLIFHTMIVMYEVDRLILS